MVVTLVVVVEKQVTVMVMGTVTVMAVTVVSKHVRSRGVFQNHIKVDIFTNLNGRCGVRKKKKVTMCWPGG